MQNERTLESEVVPAEQNLVLQPLDSSELEAIAGGVCVDNNI